MQRVCHGDGFVSEVICGAYARCLLIAVKIAPATSTNGLAPCGASAVRGGRGIVIRADGDYAHLVRREPEREAASTLLSQKTDEPCVGANWRLLSVGAVVAGEDSRRRPEETIPSRRKDPALNAISSWPGARPLTPILTMAVATSAALGRSAANKSS